MPKYEVVRPHIGDKAYKPGDVREANEGDVAHLVKKGVLATPSAKAEHPSPRNKAAAKPANKAAKPVQNKAD